MEKLLIRLARQLDAIDEASLMSLWSKYATLSGRFEPTARWEEAALIFSLIQAKRWKNQLFNYYWSQQSKLRDLNASQSRQNTQGSEQNQQNSDEIFMPDFNLELPGDNAPQGKRCRVLSFKPSAQTADAPSDSAKPAKGAKPVKDAKPAVDAETPDDYQPDNT